MVVYVVDVFLYCIVCILMLVDLGSLVVMFLLFSVLFDDEDRLLIVFVCFMLL